VLLASPIAENLQRCDRALCTACKGKEAPYGCSYNDEWFLDSGASAHFIPFESDFVSMTQGNYGRVETANSEAPLFMVVVGTILIEHEIIYPKDRTTRTAILSSTGRSRSGVGRSGVELLRNGWGLTTK